MWLILFIFVLLLASDGEAAFSSRFSLTVGEEYNDNIFFIKNKDHDFITVIIPTLSLFYEPPAASGPALTLNIAPTGQIFARHSELSNFGKNLSLSSGYAYPYSPRLSFHAADTLALRSETRTEGLGSSEGGFGQLRATPTSRPVPGGTEPLSSSQRLGDFISNGDTLANHFSLQGRYLYAPNITFAGGYTGDYTAFLDRGGSEFSHTLGLRGVYNWRQEHNLFAGYNVSIIKSRNGENNVVHNFEIGDDYFSSTQIQLTPTLTLAGSTGISLNAGSSGPRIANNTAITLTKLWETAVFTAGVRKGLTNSFGVSGVSDTTTLFSGLNVRFTERVSGFAGLDFSLFDTDDVNFKTFHGHGGVQYAITNWLCSTLRYSHRWRDAGSGAANTDLLTRGTVNSNSVFLTFSVDFEVWPNPGLAKRPGCGVAIPATPQPSPRL